MDRKSNKIRVGNQDKEDRISSLPDSVLCHILSFLPTKYAVATSILSSRWKLVWSSLPSLCFDDRLCLEYKRTNRLTNDASTRFENFVNRVLVLSQQLNIDKFSLNCFKIRYPACLKFLVSTTIMRNVREIELNLKHQNRVELPESIYTCKALEVLKLDSDFTIKIPPSGTCFPSLKIFRVVMYYPDNDLTERLFSMCPVLEDLSIEGFLDDDDLAINFNISSSTLKRLEVTLTKDGICTYNEHKVIIRAPNLEQLYIGDFVFVSYMVHELHSLSKAFIDVFYMGEGEILANCVLELLKDITGAQFLSLLTGTISTLDHAYENSFPVFPNLTCLKVEVRRFGWRMLPVILNSSPNLETFVFEKDGNFGFVEEEFGWIESWSVPHCLHLCVKRIEIRGFEGWEDELRVIKYLLKNSEVLDRMIIRSYRKPLERKLCQKLLMFERGFKTWQVEFV